MEDFFSPSGSDLVSKCCEMAQINALRILLCLFVFICLFVVPTDRQLTAVETMARHCLMLHVLVVFPALSLSPAMHLLSRPEPYKAMGLRWSSVSQHPRQGEEEQSRHPQHRFSVTVHSSAPRLLTI